MSKNGEIIVVGAGIVGISIALELQKRGWAVRVLDRAGVANETSAASAGAFAFTDIMPLATPGIMRKAPKWLLDPLGPLSVPPSYALKIAPWMLRFWRASWRDRFSASMQAQTQLMTLSRAALERQILDVDGEHLMQREGQLQLYEGEKEFRDSLPGWEMRREFGIAFSLMDTADQIAEVQPGLNPRFTHAGFTPDWMNTVDPKTWAKHLAEIFRARGGQIEQVNVQALGQRGEILELQTSEGRISAGKVVIAAGAWSHQLARTIGDKIPLETERGYNTTLPPGAFDLRTHLTFGGHGFVVSRINGGVRVGGAVELGGLSLPPNFRRSEILLEKAARFMPGLKTEKGKQWMGFRPSLPDSLPVIGPSPRQPGNVFYAFGHGHLGLTQAAGTAELTAAILSGDTPDLQMTAYATTRF
ncbi:D-amino acid dehydrogenase small subunit [Roseovarius litorisediminis]|uniref:D-amino acid dehydrogenase small subunit n=1 Tax=Roseovarius litorisediminis TaxID=1312363 RepID=A0A1Y5SCJ2_9RHOB|nr:FAD-binding oxidoreductase [Roseovarius litorisediminis]SLN37508.1 D-amino acid dehydrogenase small subunit [Roseovarius litorisediminis]